MKKWQKRVVEEKLELDKRISKLNNFICGESNSNFVRLSAKERARLWRQLDAMKLYSEVLGERIEAFKGDTP